MVCDGRKALNVSEPTMPEDVVGRNFCYRSDEAALIPSITVPQAPVYGGSFHSQWLIGRRTLEG